MNKEPKHCFTLSELRELFFKAGQSSFAFQLPIYSHEIDIFRKQLFIEGKERNKEYFIKFIYQIEKRDGPIFQEVELPLSLIFSLSSKELFDVIKNSFRK